MPLCILGELRLIIHNITTEFSRQAVIVASLAIFNGYTG